MINRLKRQTTKNNIIYKQQQESGIDVAIERLNQKIGKLLGKKHNHKKHPEKKPSETISNRGFSIVIICVFCLLWVATGFYYINDNQDGIVLNNGRVSNVVHGMRVGFTLPYPFGDIIVLNSGVSNLVTINRDDINDSGYVVLSKDLVPIKVDAKFSYQIVDPKLLFKTTSLINNNLDESIRYKMQLQFRNYIMHKFADDVMNGNVTIAANKIKQSANQVLKAIGVKIVKVEIGSFSYINHNSKQESTINKKQQQVIDSKDNMPVIAVELIKQAESYQRDKLALVKDYINQFNQLLPQYKKDPEGVMDQLYYNMLSKVPTKTNKVDNYPLLNLTLSQLLKQGSDSTSSDNSSVRDFSRTVRRYRNFGGQ